MVMKRNQGPLYLQLKKVLKDRILHGIYPLGTLIPSEPQLEQEFDVSKMTVRNAVKELAQEGLIEKRSGIGTKVIRNTSLTKLSKGKRFTEILVEEGHQIRKSLIRSSWNTNEAGSALFDMFGKNCLRVERLYELDGKPYIHYVHYLAPSVPQAKDNELGSQSLYEFIEESHIVLDKFRDQFTVGMATDELAKLLSVPVGTALLKRIRYSLDATEQIMEYSEGHYNTELQHYLVSYDV
ncbi:DNA-binding GntR family transcriptional regulator [Paenibacillus shirakamiensis]|uniref:DNA-binding GntR family transcriptional regulator n=1 Tax=Paenibacillus shirakamiensis TaxID=1265935 RepID=A0ABS4JH93_9BACL|nr:GntR family transcriptional regulator [Paenibacillus shirakamiensis]MBP2000321.1 DNA-binding GntR family transcriptional regulator [Paenibacillus shirakamiensis]